MSTTPPIGTGSPASPIGNGTTISPIGTGSPASPIGNGTTISPAGTGTPTSNSGNYGSTPEQNTTLATEAPETTDYSYYYTPR